MKKCKNMWDKERHTRGHQRRPRSWLRNQGRGEVEGKALE